MHSSWFTPSPVKYYYIFNGSIHTDKNSQVMVHSKRYFDLTGSWPWQVCASVDATSDLALVLLQSSTASFSFRQYFFKSISVHSNVVKYTFIISQLRKQCMEFPFTLPILQDTHTLYFLTSNLSFFSSSSNAMVIITNSYKKILINKGVTHFADGMGMAWAPVIGLKASLDQCVWIDLDHDQSETMLWLQSDQHHSVNGALKF